jgi:AmiR/NasT family two-component response regulator
VIIEQAKGVIAQHAELPMTEAFERLRGYSRSNNLRLAEVARAIATAQLDPALLTSATVPVPRGRHLNR